MLGGSKAWRVGFATVRVQLLLWPLWLAYNEKKYAFVKAT
jgi:hypothetical protein